MIRRACLLLAVLCISLTACSTNDDEPSGKDSDMTPDEAYAALEKVSLDLLDEVAEPGSVQAGSASRTVPCGGLEGNERNKVSRTYSATASAADRDTVMDSATSSLKSWGLEVSPPSVEPVGEQLSFSNNAFSAALIMNRSGALKVGGETACLDNPDQ